MDENGDFEACSACFSEDKILCIHSRTTRWVEDLKAATKRFNIEGWPEGLADTKIEGFLDFLEYGRRVLWQDWAISRALAERCCGSNRRVKLTGRNHQRPG